jgi:adenylate cyclase
LRAVGYSVWLDDDLAVHREFTQAIEEQLTAAKAALVIWSADAAKSAWVLSEANRAREEHKLVQLRVDGARLPMPFDQIQCADLSGWSGDGEHPAWGRVVESVAELVKDDARPDSGQAPVAVPPKAPPLPDKPSIAVMPFANLSGDPEQGYFADGMVVEIVEALARIPSFFVIASSSTLALKGQAVSALDAARRLGVQYVLEGNVRRSSGRVRIGVQLIDTSSSAPIWTHRFEDTLEDVFDLQDRVALAVAGKIEPTLTMAEMRRVATRSQENMGAYDLYLRALPLVSGFSREISKGLDLLDRAIALDPNYGLALAAAAAGHFFLTGFGWSNDVEADLRRAADLADRALRVAGDDPTVLADVALIKAFVQGNVEAARALIGQALELNPGSALAWATSGSLQLDPGLAIEHIERSMRLDPFGPNRVSQTFNMAEALIDQARYPEALTLLREVVALADENPGVFLLLAVVAARVGLKGEAADALKRFASLTPLSPDAFLDRWTRAMEVRQTESALREGIALAEAAAREVSDT